MPIRGDRLRWPPRPGKKFPAAAGSAGTKRALSTDEQPADPNQSLRQPNERDESADQQASQPRGVMEQAHDDIESGKEDTDCRNQTAEVIDQASAPHQSKRRRTPPSQS